MLTAIFAIIIHGKIIEVIHKASSVVVKNSSRLCHVLPLHLNFRRWSKNSTKCCILVKSFSKTSLFLYRYLVQPSAAVSWGFTANSSLTDTCKLLWLLGQSEKLYATGSCCPGDRSYYLRASLIWWRKESKLVNYLFFGLSSIKWE